VPSDRTRGNWHRLEHRNFHMNMGKNFFTVTVTERRNRLPREVVQSGDTQTHLNAICCREPALAEG